MTRRELLRLTCTSPLWLSSSQSRAAATSSAPSSLSPLDRYNTILGTQSIGATYQFTRENLLLESARAALAMGSSVFKFTMGRGCQRFLFAPSRSAYPDTMQYLLNQGSDAAVEPRIRFPNARHDPVPAREDIRTLTDLAQREPVFAQVFSLPFASYHIWTYAFTPRWWNRGFGSEDQQKEYEEIRAFAAYLFRTYNRSGKTFYLGHWEGDWHLRPSLKIDTDAEVTPESLRGMIDWLRVRQRAIDDAKRDTPHEDVQIYHYCEVNHVTAVSREKRPSVCNRVLPEVDVDYVSYSAYDSLGDIAANIPRALDDIEKKLPSKKSIAGKRVFIGEYGFPAHRVPEPDRDRKSRQIMRIGLEWGCPFILCWQMYNNEWTDGHENGYWLINDRNEKTQLWHTHHAFYQKARQWLKASQERERQLPDPATFRRFALESLAGNSE